ncbi:MAG: hypothetical protein EOM72_08175 [Opitutae bacterium]|nr:hypothetical protein [Opitutae bacterium]
MTPMQRIPQSGSVHDPLLAAGGRAAASTVRGGSVVEAKVEAESARFVRGARQKQNNQSGATR